MAGSRQGLGTDKIDTKILGVSLPVKHIARDIEERNSVTESLYPHLSEHQTHLEGKYSGYPTTVTGDRGDIRSYTPLHSHINTLKTGHTGQYDHTAAHGKDERNCDRQIHNVVHKSLDDKDCTVTHTKNTSVMSNTTKHAGSPVSQNTTHYSMYPTDSSESSYTSNSTE